MVWECGYKVVLEGKSNPAVTSLPCRSHDHISSIHLNKGPFSLLLFFQNSFFPEFLKVGNSLWKRDPEILIAQLDTSLHIQVRKSQQRTGHHS